MAQTFREYNAPATYSFTFPSYQSSDVKVRVDGVLKTAGVHYNISGYTTTGGGTVVFIDNSGSGGTNHTPSSGVVRIYRDTNVDAAKAEFTPGSSVKAADLNNNTTQLLYRAQEEQVPNLIQSYDINAGAIETSNIKPDNITSALIADDQINSEHYVAGSIDHEHLANDIIDGDNIQDDVINSEHYVAGSIDHEHLANDIIDGDNIQDNSINSEHITGGAVDLVHMSANSIDSDQYVDGSIDTAHIGDSQVTTAKIAPDAINNTKLADNAVQTENIVNAAVTTTKIDDGNVTTAKIADDAVTNAKIGTGAVGTTELDTGAVTTAKLAADSVTNAKIGAGAVGTTELDTAAITTAKIANDAVTNAKIGAGAVGTTELDTAAITTAKIANDAVTADKISDAVIVTDSEQASHSVNNTTFFTTAAAEARYFNASTGETIKDGQTFPDNDTTIATTAAINDRIIDLVDDVGGFVPIANETSFPTANPDVNNGTGTIVSVKAASTNLAPSGTTVTIANGAGTGNTVTITGVSATIPSGFGFLVETTTTLHTYTFHRLSPKATEVTTVAGISGNVTTVAGIASNVTTVANNNSNVTAVANNSSNINSAVSNASNINSAVSNASNINSAVSNASNINTVAGSITNVNNVGGSIASVNTAASNLTSINNFGDKYQVASSNPSTDGGGNALAAGDLYFNTSANELKVYTGSQWQGGVTATGNFATVTGNTFTGDNIYNDNIKAKFGTDSDLEIFHSGGNSTIKNTTSGSLLVHGDAIDLRPTTESGEVMLRATRNGSVELRHDNSTKLETTSTGAAVTGSLGVGTTSPDFPLETVYTNSNSGTFSTSLAMGSGTNANLYAGHLQNLGTGNSEVGLLFSAGNTQYGQWSINCVKTGAFVSDLAFRTRINSAGSTERFKIRANGDVAITGDKGLYIGANDDLLLAHDGSLTRIADTFGHMKIGTNTLEITNQALSENYIKAVNNGSVELYYDNSKKAETTTNGFQVINGKLDIFNTSGGASIRNMSSSGTFFLGNANHADLALYVQDSTDNSIILQVNTGEKMLECTAGGSTDLYNHGSKKLETTSTGIKIFSGSSGLDDILTLDSTGNSQGHGGKIGFRRAGDLRAEIQAVKVETSHNETDIVFKTTKTGSLFEALRIVGDTKNVQIPNDTGRLQLGASQDLEIFHNGSQSTIQSANVNNLTLRQQYGGGYLFIHGDNLHLRSQTTNELYFEGVNNGAAKLYYDNSKKLETASTGTTTTGQSKVDVDTNLNSDTEYNGQDFGFLVSYDGGDAAGDEGNGICFAQKYFSGATGTVRTGAVIGYKQQATGNFGGGLKFKTQKPGANPMGTALQLDQDQHVLLPNDNTELRIGASADLRLYHNGSSSVIRDNGAGNLQIAGSTIQLTNAAIDENMLIASPNGSVKLLYDNAEKLETTSSGVTVTGGVTATAFSVGDNQEIKLGAGNDLKLFHNGNHSYIADVGTGDLRITGSAIHLQNAAQSENMIRTFQDGAVELYYDNSKKLETNNGGVQVFGDLRIKDNENIYLGDGADLHISVGANDDGVINQANGDLKFQRAGSGKFSIKSDGTHFFDDVFPATNNTYNLGSTSLRWANVYTNDLHLSNEGSSNDMDGTWGDWTMQEGESDLFLKNNRSGKKYKFNLTEVS